MFIYNINKNLKCLKERDGVRSIDLKKEHREGREERGRATGRKRKKGKIQTERKRFEYR